MSLEKARELFSRKITDQSTFDSLLVESGIYNKRDYGPDPAFRQWTRPGLPVTKAYDRASFTMPRGADGLPPPYYHGPGFAVMVNYWPVSHWWLLRENLRLTLGVYAPLSDALLSYLPGYHNFLHTNHVFHTSKAEPEMVAYTASAADGLIDRQVRASPGKVLKKFHLLLNDSDVQTIEAAHRAECSDEVEFVTGADAIRGVYTSMVGDSGCMRYRPECFGLPEHLHPSIVYDAPGFAVAVHRNAQGQVVARSVTWVNPEDENDKRYIRLYGDPVLKRKLERKGYRLRNFMGATLRAVSVPGRTDYYVMPYIDGPGGNTESSYDGRNVKLVDNGIKLVSGEELDLVQRVTTEPFVVRAMGTEGKILLKRMPEDLFSYTCALTGQKHNRLEQEPVPFLRPDGTYLEEVCPGSIPNGAVRMFTLHDGTSVLVLADPATPHFERGGQWWFDSDETRRYVGYGRLSARHYPDEQGWVHSADMAIIDLPDGSWIKEPDAVDLVLSTDATEPVIAHRSDVTDQHVKLYSRGRARVPYAAPGVEYQTTVTGRVKAHPAVHDVKMTFDGRWDFSRNLVQANVLGQRIRIMADQPIPLLEEIPLLAQRIRPGLEFSKAQCDRAGYDRARTTDSLEWSALYTLGSNVPEFRNNSWRLTSAGTRSLAEVKQASQACVDAAANAGVSSTDANVRAARDALWLIRQVEAYLAEIFPAPVPATQPEAAERFVVA